MAVDGCGGVLELLPTVRSSEKLKRVNTTTDLECLGLQWLEARLRFLARDRGPVQKVRALNPSHYRLMVSDKVLALELCRKRILTMMESSVTKYLLGEKKVQYIWIDPWVNSVAESHLRGSLNYLYGAFLLVFLG